MHDILDMFAKYRPYMTEEFEKIEINSKETILEAKETLAKIETDIFGGNFMKGFYSFATLYTAMGMTAGEIYLINRIITEREYPEPVHFAGSLFLRLGIIVFALGAISFNRYNKVAKKEQKLFESLINNGLEQYPELRQESSSVNQEDNPVKRLVNKQGLVNQEF